MSGLLRFIAKLVGRGRPRTPAKPASRAAHSPETPELDIQTSAVRPPDPPSTSPRSSPQAPEPSVVFLDLAEDEDIAEDLEDESDEPDPTIGRYEELHVAVLDAAEVGAQRAAAEMEGLSGPHKVFPHDPAGPGSLAETLARLETEGRVTSRICDDADSGFYVLYEPADPAANG